MAVPNVQIGSTVLNLELLVFLVAGIFGVMAVRFRMRRHPGREAVVSDAWSSVFIWLAVWKGSLFVVDPSGVIDHPQSLLYFNGGAPGMWAASVAVGGFMGFRQFRKIGVRLTAEVTATWGAGMAAVVLGVYAYLADSAGSLLIGGLLVSLAVLTLLLSPSLKVAAQVSGAILVVTMVAYTVFDFEDSKTIRVHQAAPEFRLADLSGNEVSLSDYRGKTVLLNFWATWCMTCRAEMPHVEKLYQKYKGQDVVILSVNATSQEKDAQRVAEYAAKQSLNFPIVLDDDGSVLKQYKVTAYPTTYIIDPSGAIRDRYLGAMSYDNMKKALQAD